MFLNNNGDLLHRQIRLEKTHNTGIYWIDHEGCYFAYKGKSLFLKSLKIYDLFLKY